jgi:hypothetical protein
MIFREIRVIRGYFPKEIPMQGMRFTVSVHIHGTLAANATGMFALPCPAQLVEVSFCNTTTSDAILDVGTAADPDGILADVAVGDSEAPAVYQVDDFNGALIDGDNPYHMDAGTVIEWLLDFDGASGTAAANASILFTFLEG